VIGTDLRAWLQNQASESAGSRAWLQTQARGLKPAPQGVQTRAQGLHIRAGSEDQCECVAESRAWLQTQGRGSAGLHAWLQTHARRSTDPCVKAAYPGGGRRPGCRTARLNAHPPVRSLLTSAGVLQQVHLPWTWSPTKSRVHLDLAGGCADLSA